MLAPAPLNNDPTPSFATIFLAQSIDPAYFSPSPEVIIILLLMVSIGQEAKPAPTVTPHPSKKLTIKFPLYSLGTIGLIESYTPKQSPLQITIPTQLMTNPLQRPAIPSEARVFLQTSINPLNCFCPPFLAFFKSLVNLVRAQSREYTNKSETDPAAPPEARFPKNQVKQPSLSLSLANILLKQSLREKLRAWVGKYLITLVPFPFQKAFTPSSLSTLLKQLTKPVYGLSNAPDLSKESIVCNLILITQIGDAHVLDTAAETPPIKNSRANVTRPLGFSLIFVDKIIQGHRFNKIKLNNIMINSI